MYAGRAAEEIKQFLTTSPLEYSSHFFNLADMLLFGLLVTAFVRRASGACAP